MTHPASRATPDPRGQVRWPRGTPWHRRGPGPGRWAPEAKWGLVHDAIAAGEGSAEHVAMVDRATRWAATLDQSISTPRAPRGGARAAAAADAQASLSLPAGSTWTAPPGWTPPLTPGGRIKGGPHSRSQTAFRVGRSSYATIHEFLQHPREVAASRGRNYGPTDPGLVQAAKKIFEFTDPQTGMRAVVDGVDPSYNGNRLSVRGRILGEHGGRVGSFTREFLPDGSVYHAYFAMDRGAQGGGFKTRWFKQLMDQYALHGFDKVTVSANIDVGGYAWAQTGFDFETDRERGQYLDGLRDAINGGAHAVGWNHRGAIAAQYRTAKARADVEALLRRHAAGEKITAQDISLVGRNPRSRSKMWFGKRFLLGTAWHGVLPL